MAARKYPVLIGPLRPYVNPDIMAKNVFRVLSSVGIMCDHIESISVNPNYGYARVDFSDPEQEAYAVKVMKELSSIINIFDLRRLADDPNMIKTQSYHQMTVQKQRKDVYKVLREMSDVSVLRTYKPLDHMDLKMMWDGRNFKSYPKPQDDVVRLSEPYFFTTVNEAVAEEDKPKEPSLMDDPRGTSQPIKPNMAHAETNTANLNPSFCHGPLYYNQNVRVEPPKGYAAVFQSAYMWFPSRQGNKRFTDNIASYLVGFLNSCSGILYIGVENNGMPTGFNMSCKQRDQLILIIDQRIQEIKPLIPMAQYRIYFTNLITDQGIKLENTVVLNVQVTHVPFKGEKYRFQEYINEFVRGKLTYTFYQPPIKK